MRTSSPGCVCVRMARLRIGWVCVGVLMSALLATCQDVNNEEQIDISRIKRENGPDNRDLTVLLVNDKRNEYNTKTGRYHNVKPLIGLLTSTARTFILDGVTTEYATQILGTTLDNGRIYAQLLTKSSLVLYNKPAAANDIVDVKPTRVHSAFDGEWSVKQDLGLIDPDKFVLKNTDYLAPSKMDIVYPNKPSLDNVKYWNAPTAPYNQENQILDEPTGRRVQAFSEIPRYVQNEAFNFLDGPTVENEKKLEYIQPSILDNVNVLHRHSKALDHNIDSTNNDSHVPADTPSELNVVKVKPNYELPTFTIKNEFSPIFYYIDNVESRGSQPQVGQQTKLPKKLFGQKSEPRTKKTFTYAGFADFTTVVGDTVIIFTPNTDINRPQNPDEVNVFPSAKPVDKLATKITHLASDIPVATSTYKAHEVNAITKINSPKRDENRSDKALYNDEESLKKVLYEVDKMPDQINIQYNNDFDLNLDVIQPSEGVTSTESTKLTNNLGVIPLHDYSSQATEPLSPIRPSATFLSEPKESAVTEKDTFELFTNSEEDSDNTAAEVTEADEDTEIDTTTEIYTDDFTTTESSHSDESEEQKPTTEGKVPQPDEEICTKGFVTKSTMTTEYKTLTYLTTYFIPLENTDTTTEIKSNVVVDTQVGYLTNVVCKSDADIEPTAVVSVEVKSSIQSSLDRPETSEESAIKPPETSSTPPEKVNGNQDISDQVNNSQESTSEEERETTSTTSTTTTERIEVSVSTEKSTTPAEKLTTPEASSEENEIDLIYKTLYTTYTYFTTFFGDHDSTVASHKSIVTNVITSTIDLAKIDPSILSAFDDDEIAPTGVGIGRPTETYAINSIIDLVKNKDVLESVEGNVKYTSQTPTPTLGDDIASIKPDAVKTYYTTYTFFTTIYVGSDANICSRREVYTNYVGPDELIPTKIDPLSTESTRAQFDFRNCKQVKKDPPTNPEENSSMESSVSMEENQSTEETKKDVTPQPTPLEVDMLFSVEANPVESENSYVTDVKSSSSKGERKYLENNNVLDDQISSESNIDEIMPSPTLLLQTSYTTFTYFTTMYIGKDASKVKSRLETITNVVTETIMPKKDAEEENNLPITYYTTFTYWTTLYKDKSTTITSREEIVSNVVTPPAQTIPTVSPIDTMPIEIDSVLPPKDLEVEIKPSLLNDNLGPDDGKATFFTTYTYFTTFYASNTSQIRSSLETVTNIVDNTKGIDDNQLGRKVPTGPADKNLIQDKGEKPVVITPTPIKEAIEPTKLPDNKTAPTVLSGTYIDNLFAEVKPDLGSPPSSENAEKKVIFSQVAVLLGNSTVVTSDNKTLDTDTSSTTFSTTEGSIISPTSEVIQSSVAEIETTPETKHDTEEEEDGTSSRKKGRLTYTAKKPSVTPVIRPFASRNRPTFSPKRVPLLSSATTITRADFTPTITATPVLKTVRGSGGFGGNRRPAAVPGSSSSSRRFTGRGSSSNLAAGNVPLASRSGGFNRPSIQPTSRRTGFRSSSISRPNSLDFSSRSAVPRIRPTASLRPRGGRQSVTVSLPPPDQNESETSQTQQEENATESLDEVTEAPVKTTNNPLSRFRRPPIARQPGTGITPRTTAAPRKAVTSRGRLSTTTKKTITRSTVNPLLALRRQRPANSLFPKRNLFKQPEPQPEEEIKENEQKVEESEELLDEEEGFDEDNDYESSDRKEQQVSTPSTQAPKRANTVQIRPFNFRRRTKRQADYGSRKYSNFRRPGVRTTTHKPEPETETEPPVTQKVKPGGRYSSRLSSNTRTTTAAAAPRSSARQPFIIRGESRTTTTATPAYRRAKTRTNSRTTTSASRLKAPRLSGSSRSGSPRSSGRSRTRTTTSRASNRQRGSYENHSGERYNNFNNILDDGKFTVTYHIPTEVTIPVVNGKITEYKSVISASPKVETLLDNQVTSTIGPLGNTQLLLLSEATELGENGVTKLIKFHLHETPTTTVIFTPTSIRGRKTSFSHVLPSTVYNVEPVTQTVTPEINANVPLANLLLSQLLLGNQQPAINPLLALQGQGLIPQQPVAPTPVTEFKTRTTTYVTTLTDARATVLTITFRATPIETTITDPTLKVITATEYITDKIVTTPTAMAQPPQFNSLLLLLQQQQQQQQQQQIALQTVNPLLGLQPGLGQPDLSLLQSNNLNNDIYSNSPKPNILSDLNTNEDFGDEVSDEVEEIPLPPPPKRKNKPKPPKPAPPKHTSVVTLYVSGRHPGEFSTVLSTVVSDDTQSVRKREAIYYEDVKILPSLLPNIDDLASSQDDNRIDNSAIPDIGTYLDSPSVDQETQSLESIVGDISKYIKYNVAPTYVVKLVNPASVRENKQISLDKVS